MAHPKAAGHRADAALAAVLLMLAACFCAGYGYVISATFIVEIVEREPLMAWLRVVDQTVQRLDAEAKVAPAG